MGSRVTSYSTSCTIKKQTPIGFSNIYPLDSANKHCANNETRAVARLENKTRQVSRAEGASRWGGLGACPPENFEI